MTFSLDNSAFCVMVDERVRIGCVRGTDVSIEEEGVPPTEPAPNFANGMDGSGDKTFSAGKAVRGRPGRRE